MSQNVANPSVLTSKKNEGVGKKGGGGGDGRLGNSVLLNTTVGMLYWKWRSLST